MNPEFQEHLMRYSFDEIGSSRARSLEKDYRKIIALGAYTEPGEHYYLFIYRHLQGPKIAYDGILFLYDPFNLSTPLKTHVTDTRMDLRRKNVFIQAAVYCLKHGLENTMPLTGSLEPVYGALKPLAEKQEEKLADRKEEFETFDFDVQDQAIRVREIPAPGPDKSPPGAPYRLKQVLKRFNRPRPSGKGAVKKKTRAHLGLCLDFGTGKNPQLRFKPVAVSVKKSGPGAGEAGTVRPVTAANLTGFRWEKPHPLLYEYMTQLLSIGRGDQRDDWREETVGRLYFFKLAALLPDLPDFLAVYTGYPAGESGYLPLRAVTAASLSIHFAPDRRGGRVSLFLQVTAVDGRVFTPGSQFRLAGETDPSGSACMFFSDHTQTGYWTVFRQQAPVTPDMLGTPDTTDAPGAQDTPAPTVAGLWALLEEIKTVPAAALDDVVTVLEQWKSPALELNPGPLPRFVLEYKPVPVLKIVSGEPYGETCTYLRVEFDYHSGRERFRRENPDKRLLEVEPDPEFEKMCLAFLSRDPLLELQTRQDYWAGGVEEYRFLFHGGDEWDWLRQRGNIYLEKGFKIYNDLRKQYIGHTSGKLRIELRPGSDWLAFQPLLSGEESGGGLEIGDIDWEAGRITDKKGDLHLVEPGEMDQLSRLARFAEQKDGVFRVPSQNVFLINQLYDKRMEDMPEIKDKLLSAEGWKSFESIPEYDVSHDFKGTLRPYQLAGFRWLRFLLEYNLGGCLADDMGLGKTVQTLALLQTLKNEGRLSTSLLVVPVSAVPNWEMEIGRFAPDLVLCRHMGAGRDKNPGQWQGVDLVITSYSTMRNDIHLLGDFPFDYIVLDEAQNIKNPGSQVSRAVKVLKSSNRLALSGTPIENNSMELWSIMDFLLPGFLGNRRWFNSQWANPVEKQEDDEKAHLLKQMIYPFILRRKKEDVEKDLPAKTEIVETLPMGDEQRELYVRTARYYKGEIQKEIDSKGLEKSSFKILEGMLRLRQMCLFPQLVDPEYAGTPSVKFAHFVELMEDILAGGHKVLVFSQFVKVLGFLREHLDRENVSYAYLDGSVSLKERGRLLKVFQQEESMKAFLLSLKAGGVALNLTAADYVIIFDPWWNPAVEAQAIDRSHRIGQTRKVFVYRLMVKDTIEEKMLTLQRQKRELVDKLITSEAKGFKDLSKEDIMMLFT